MRDFNEMKADVHAVSEDIRSYVLKINEYYDEIDDAAGKDRCLFAVSNLRRVMSRIEGICSDVFGVGAKKNNNPYRLSFYVIGVTRCLESEEHRAADPEKYDESTDTLFVELEVEARNRRYSNADLITADEIHELACFECTLKARVGTDNDVEHMTFRVDDEGVYYIKDDCWEPTVDKYNYSVRYDPNDPKTFTEADIDKMIKIKEAIQQLSYGHSMIDTRSIDELDFPEALSSRLKRFGVETISELKEMDLDEFSQMDGIGKKRMHDLVTIANDHGIDFGLENFTKYL